MVRRGAPHLLTFTSTWAYQIANKSLNVQEVCLPTLNKHPLITRVKTPSNSVARTVAEMLRNLAHFTRRVVVLL